MKNFIKNGLISMIIGMLLLLIPTVQFGLRKIASFFLSNTNNAVWAFGFLIFNALLFFILGMLIVPSIKIIYKTIINVKKPKIKLKKNIKIKGPEISIKLDKKTLRKRRIKKAGKILLYSILYLFLV